MIDHSSPTVGKALEEAARKYPGKTGWIYMGREISYSEMNEAADRLAAGFLKLGLKKGDRIGIIALNQPEWLYAYFAAAKIGLTIVGLNVRYRSQELDYILNQSETRAVITLPFLGEMNYVEFFQSFRDKIPSVEHYIFLGAKGFEGSHTLEELMDEPGDEKGFKDAKSAVSPEDPLIIIYTSGTTGTPKGAVITHRSQLASARAQAEHCRFDENDLIPLALPFNHVGGITCGILSSLVAKSRCLLLPAFDPGKIIELSRNYKYTIMVGVPTMHTLVLLNEKIGEMETSRIRLVITGGSNAEPQLLEKLHKTFPGATVMNLYGLSESSGAIVMSPWDSDFETTVRSIGKPIGNFEVKVVDEKGKELPPGEIGELLFRGDAICQGYFRMPEETAESFDREGWLHTGDMGYVDENGYITLMGRKKEMYVQGGFNVYPAEVENLLTKHPKVLMAAGIGVPDPVLGEVGRYYIVPKPGCELTEEEVIEYCRKHLADYKVPKQVVFRKELPMTPVGKIMKSKLKEEYEKSGE